MLIFIYKNRWENSARTVHSDDSLAQLFLMIKWGQKSVRFFLIYLHMQLPPSAKCCTSIFPKMCTPYCTMHVGSAVCVFPLLTCLRKCGKNTNVWGICPHSQLFWVFLSWGGNRQSPFSSRTNGDTKKSEVRSDIRSGNFPPLYKSEGILDAKFVWTWKLWMRKLKTRKL